MTDRILWYGDSPTCSSGFGNVSEGITSRLLNDYKIDFYAINYRTKDRHQSETYDDCHFEDASSGGDVYGRVDLVEMLNHIRGDKYDYIVLFQDATVLSAYLDKYDDTFIGAIGEICEEKDIHLISYFPIDAELYSIQLTPVLKASDLSITYTDWAVDKVKKVIKNDENIKPYEYDLNKLYHGTELDVFKPAEEAAKEKLDKFDLTDDFIVGYLSANQQRKNIVRDVIHPFVKFHQDNPDSTLLLKTSPIEQQGWNLVRVLRKYKKEGLITEKSVRFYSKNKIPQSEINVFYNMCDVFYLPSMEGWGLGATEAMAAETLTMTADHAALSEVADETRSVKIDVPDDFLSNNQVWFTLDNDVRRTMIDLEDAVNKLNYVKNEMSEGEKNHLIRHGKQFVESYTWDDIAKKFNNFLGRLKYS